MVGRFGIELGALHESCIVILRDDANLAPHGSE
jgi:hypothetical protein